MASVEDYRRHAAQSLSLAQSTDNPDDKARLLQMAEAWHELADRLAHKIAIEETLSENTTKDK